MTGKGSRHFSRAIAIQNAKQAREKGDLTYHGRPHHCGSTEKYTRDCRCATCARKRSRKAYRDRRIRRFLDGLELELRTSGKVPGDLYLPGYRQLGSSRNDGVLGEQLSLLKEPCPADADTTPLSSSLDR